MRKPKKLNKGDTIGIVAPASSFDIDSFKLGIKKLRSLGYKVKYERNIFSKYWSKSGYDKKRAEQINRMFFDKNVKAILCAKAGYGSVDIIPYLDESIIRENPKIFVGYSDITALLLYLQKISQMVVFHGPVVSGEIYEGMSSLTLDYLLHVITKNVPLGDLSFPDLKAIRDGIGSGLLVGGNMSLIADTLNTYHEIDANNNILFLEDVDEDLESIIKSLKMIKGVGNFKKLKGIVFGKMTNCFNNMAEEKIAKEKISELFNGLDISIPILYGFPSGHIAKRGESRVTLPLGLPVTVNSEKLTVTIEESAVS